MAISPIRAGRTPGPAFISLFVWITLLLACASHTQAVELPKPTGKVVLTLTGNIDNHNRKDLEGRHVVDLDMAMLQGLERHAFRTKTPWTEGNTEFEGATLKALLDFVGAESNSFRATALDEYSIVVSGLDLQKYPIIVAYAKDGKPMRIRELGPLWIMFPFDDFPELLNEKKKAAAIWQLITMAVL